MSKRYPVEQREHAVKMALDACCSVNSDRPADERQGTR
jgi:hypothetical protein